MTRKRRVHVFPEHTGFGDIYGVGFIRLLDPIALACQQTARPVSVRLNLTSPDDGGIVVLQRGGIADKGVERLRQLCREVRESGLRIVYDLDDFLVDPSSDSDEAASLAVKVRFLLRAADVVTCSTAALREKLLSYAENVVVIENCVSKYAPQPAESPEPAIVGGAAEPLMRLGYMGTPTHQRDLLANIDCIVEALAGLKVPSTFTFVGIDPPSIALRMLSSVCVVDQLSGYPTHYAEFMRWFATERPFDIGLVPLEDSEFNECKSDAKFLDYTVAGICTIASSFGAYRLLEGNPGIALCRSPADWTAAISRLSLEASARHDQLLEARRYCLGHRTLSGGASKWDSIFSSLDD